MKHGIQKVSERLYQAALLDVLQEGVPSDVDIVVLMAEAGLGNSPIAPRLVYYPIPDDANGLSQADYYAVHTIAALAAPLCVLTVCHAGENRSGLVSALILIERGMTPAAARDLVQANGSHNSPTQPHSLWNPGFCAHLASLT